MRCIARYKIRSEIRYHQRLREVFVYAKEHGICTQSFNHSVYVQDMNNRAEFEQRYVNRLTKLLNKYL